MCNWDESIRFLLGLRKENRQQWRSLRNLVILGVKHGIGGVGQESLQELKPENRATTKQPLSLGSLAHHRHNESFPGMDLEKKEGSQDGLFPKWNIFRLCNAFLVLILICIIHTVINPYSKEAFVQLN